QADDLREDLRGQVFGRLKRDGGQPVVRRLLEGGLYFHLSAGTVREIVHIRLDLGDPQLAQQATTRATEWVPIGFKGVGVGGSGGGDHIAVEGDHESISGVGRSVAASRSLGATVNLLWAYGGLPNALMTTQAGIGVSGAATNSSSYGTDAVSAT